MRSSHNTSIPWRTIGMALALASALGCGGGFYMVDAADDATAVPSSAPSRLNAVQTVRPSDAASSPIEAPESDDSGEIPNYDKDGAIFLLPPWNRQSVQIPCCPTGRSPRMSTKRSKRWMPTATARLTARIQPWQRCCCGPISMAIAAAKPTNCRLCPTS
jgi:hypothetical protein